MANEDSGTKGVPVSDDDRRYEPPAVTSLGTIGELTLANESSLDTLTDD